MDIKAQYEHSKLGTFMFNLCAKSTKFLIKHKVLYYILACTWGVLMTFLGALITAILYIFVQDSRPTTYYWVYYMMVGPDYWGGLEMGLMFIRDKKSSENHINPHEWGHTFQNCIFGPLFPFLVAIPSATRYWIQEFRSRKGKTNPDYDSIWFEDSATQCGRYAVEYIKNKTK